MSGNEPLPRRDERQEAPTADGPWDLLAQVAWYLFRCTTSTAVAVRTVFLFLGLCLSLGTLILIAGLRFDGLPPRAIGPGLAAAGSRLTLVGMGVALHAVRGAIRRGAKRPPAAVGRKEPRTPPQDDARKAA